MRTTLSHRLALFVAVMSLTCAASSATAAPGVIDSHFDFAPTYVGPRNGDLDIAFAIATLESDGLLLRSNQLGWIGDRGTPTFVWGIDRGAGREGLVGGSPSVGAGIFFDAIVVLTGNGFTEEASGFVTTFGPGGPVTTDVSGAAFTFDSVMGVLLPLDLLPSTGLEVADYRVNLWTRDAGGNAHIADFAVDGGMFGVADLRGAVPEPTSWALMIAGFGAVGASLRRRRAFAVA
jgi:PEP-CTERM motif